MNKSAWRIVLALLMLGSAAATPTLQEGIHAHPNQANASPAWPELMSSMEKMKIAMVAVEPSGSGDADFVRLMLPHHQAAIDMAKTQLLYGKDTQIRRVAQEIITDQQSEIELMQLWLKQRGPISQRRDQAPAVGESEEH